MKKALAILLCVLMISGLCCAQAQEFEYTLLQVLSRQLDANSGYRGTLTGKVSGGAPSFIDAATWAALASALPGLSLQGTYIQSKASATKGDTQVKFTLSNAAGALSALTLSGRGDVYVLSGDLLGADTIALPKEAGALYELFAGVGEGQWPPLWRALGAIALADDAWHARLDAALLPYTAKLNLWLQSNTAMTLARDAAGALVTQSVITLSPKALALEAQQLLIDLYADETLLALLREKLTSAEATAYLEPGMQRLFVQSLASLSLTESVTLSRTFNATGVMTRQTLTLPFAPGTAAQKLVIDTAYQDGAATTALTLSLPAPQGALAGAIWRLTFSGGTLEGGEAAGGDTTQNGSLYTGEFAYTAPLTDATRFTVAEDASGVQGAAPAQSAAPAQDDTREPSLAFTYSLFVDHGTEQFNASTNQRSRDYEATLLLRPVAGGNFTPQTLSLKASLYAGASSTTATHLDGEFTWRALEGDTQLTLSYQSRSTSAFAQSTADAQGAARPDLMDAQQRAAYLNGLLPLLQSRLALLASAILSGARTN